MLKDDSLVDTINLSVHGGKIVDLVTAGGKVLKGCYIDPVPYRKFSPAEWEEAFQRISRRRLADKVISGVKLTASDKQQIYFLLTGKEPPLNKRGRKSEEERNIKIAMAYLLLISEGIKTRKLIRQEIARKFDLPGNDIEGTQRRNTQDPTFYKALNNGMDLIESRSKQWIDDVENGIVEDDDDATNIAKTYLPLISDYRKKSKHLKK